MVLLTVLKPGSRKNKTWCSPIRKQLQEDEFQQKKTARRTLTSMTARDVEKGSDDIIRFSRRIYICSINLFAHEEAEGQFEELLIRTAGAEYEHLEFHYEPNYKLYAFADFT